MSTTAVKVTVVLNPEVERLLRGLALFDDRTSIDHVISKAIRVAAKQKEFREWLGKNSSVLDSVPERAATKTRAAARKAA